MKGKLRGMFMLLIFCCALVFGLPRIGAQSTAGFTKIATVTTGTTYTDSTCPDGSTCAYEVTAFNSVAESASTSPVLAVIPGTGAHTVRLTWSPGSGGGVPAGYNVYQAQSPVPPVAPAAVVN